MSTPSLEDVLAEALRAEGWTCEYHEPVGRSGECAQCDATMTKTARRMIEKIRKRWHVVEKVPVVTSEDGSARIPVETDRPQDNPHLRIEPVDQWGDRIIRPLGIPDPYRGPIKARRLAAALLSAADVAEGSHRWWDRGRSLSHDPAVEAARRVWASRYPGTGFTEPSKNAIEAAREALAPIRDIHFPRDVYVRHMATGDVVTERACDHCGDGCTKVSPGCDHCYAESIAERFRGGPAFPNGFDVQLREHKLPEPLRWRRPAKVFVNSMSDLFHNAVPDEYIAQVWAIMALAPQHTFQVLTKRHGRMRSLLSSGDFQRSVAQEWMMHPSRVTYTEWSGWPLPNGWLGVSTENQQWADIRIPALLATPAAVRFISAEPLLGPIDLDQPRCESHGRDHAYFDEHTERCSECVADGWLGELSFGHWLDPLNGGLDWVIVGGESGPAARPMHPDWARNLRDQCQNAGVPFHFKQWGEFGPPGTRSQSSNDPWLCRDGRIWTPGAFVGRPEDECVQMHRVGKKAAGRLLDGRTWDEFPAVAS